MLNSKLSLPVIALTIAVIFPLLVTDYLAFKLSLVLIYAVALLGLNILTGFNGQISLGHGAFYAIGAYVSAILMDKFDAPFWITLPAAAIVCLIVGFLFGLPALRLEGHYLALATFALALAVPQMLKHKSVSDWTGGVQGIVVLKPESPFEFMTQDQFLYYVTLIVLVIAFVVAFNILRGRPGRALIAIRNHAMAADTMGINTAMFKSTAFGISAMYTGVAGALSTLAIGFVAPDSFTVLLSITLLVGMVVGGLGTIAGAIPGALFVVFAQDLASAVTKAATWAVYGSILILFMFVVPYGVWGAILRLWRRFAARA